MVAIPIFVGNRFCMRKKRIVTIINCLNNGGAENFAVMLCNQLSEKYEVILIVKNPVEDFMLPPKKCSSNVRMMNFQSKAKWDLLFFFRLLITVVKLKPDVIHIHSSLLIFYTFFYSWFLPKCKIVHTLHSQVTAPYLKTMRWIKKASFFGCRMSQVVISEKIKMDYQNIFPDINFYVVENGIKPMDVQVQSAVAIRGKRKKLLAIGHFSTIKRFDVLADVMEMPAIREKFELEIVGEEKDLNFPMTKYIMAKGLDNIALLGLQLDVASHLAKADALVICSSQEGMPLVMLEALSVGCPIISTPVGGIPDVIQSGKNGLLCKGLDPEDIFNALMLFDAMSDVETKQIRENNQRLFNSRFSMQICAAQYESLFWSES